jgi:hypothetical protein
MRECRTYGSVRGALGNERPYRDRTASGVWSGPPLGFAQAAIIFSFASGVASRNVCIGVLPKHHRPWCGLSSL